MNNEAFIPNNPDSGRSVTKTLSSVPVVSSLPLLIVFVVLFLLFMVPSPSFAQGLFREKLALKITEPIEVDGRLDEYLWKRAPEANVYLHIQSNPDSPKPEATSVKILFDEYFIYFAIICTDSHPEEMIANEVEKDADIRNDDSVYVLIDNLLDPEYYYFGINLLGAQLDGRVSKDGEVADPRWDGTWTAVAASDYSGWTAEVAIDLRSLGFEEVKNKTIALSLARIIPRLSTSFWRGPLDPAFHLAQMPQLRTLELRLVEGVTSFKGRIFPQYEHKEGTRPGLGLDLNHMFSADIGTQVTIFPDFLTVEPDWEQVNLTRFELYYPEKRSFFSEGGEILTVPIPLFYSKRIEDIYGGAKAYGKTGPYEFMGMSVLTEKNRYTEESMANFSVFRLKRGLARSSTLGFLAANKVVEGKSIGTAGVDASIHLTKGVTLVGQFAGSYGNFGKGNFAYFLSPNYDTETLHFHFTYSYLGDYFGDNVNEVGFIRDDNRKEIDSGLRKAFILDRGEFHRFRYESNYNIYWGVDNTLRSWQVDQAVSLDLKNKFTFSVSHTEEYKLYEKDFRNRQTRLLIAYNTEETWQTVTLAVSFGSNFDRRFDMIEISKRLLFSKTFSFEYDLARLKYEPNRLAPENRDAWVHIIRVTNTFSKDTFIRFTFQYQSRMRFLYNFNQPVERSYFQILLGTRVMPLRGTVLVGVQSAKTEFGKPGDRGRTVFVKFEYTF